LKKRYWKDRATRYEGRAFDANGKVRSLVSEVHEMRREVEDKRKHWTPIKIAHRWQPRNGACELCDDPREDPRHLSQIDPLTLTLGLAVAEVLASVSAEGLRGLAARLLAAAEERQGERHG
jgi:hypothetical protein